MIFYFLSWICEGMILLMVVERKIKQKVCDADMIRQQHENDELTVFSKNSS
jgi:hypothetical protein